MILAIWVGVKVLSMPMRYAAKPATWGVAMEVPEMVLVFPSFQVEVTFKPGAQISTGAPQLEKSAFTSAIVEAATVIACLTRAGEKLLASWLLFPAATATVTPLLKS